MMNAACRFNKKHEIGVAGSKIAVARKKVGIEEGLHGSELDVLRQLCVNNQRDPSGSKILLDAQPLERVGLQNKALLKEENIRRSGVFPTHSSIPRRIVAASFSKPTAKDIAMTPSMDVTVDYRNNAFSRVHPKITQGFSSDNSQCSSSVGMGGSTLTRRMGQVRDEADDVSSTLDKMEREMRRVPAKAKRISRRKVMQGLIAMADSLEDVKERESLRKEVAMLMAKEVGESCRPTIPPKLSSGTIPIGSMGRQYEDQNNHDKENDTLAWFTPPTNVFKSNVQRGKEAESVLDDLLWTEFVASRKGVGKNDLKSSVSTKPKVRKLSSRSHSLAQDSSASVSTMSSRRARSVCSEPHDLLKIHQAYPGRSKRNYSNRSLSNPSAFTRTSPKNSRPQQGQAPLQRDQPEMHVSEPSQVARARSWWRRSNYTGRRHHVLLASSYSEQLVHPPTSITVRSEEKKNFQSSRRGWDTVSLSSADWI